MFQQCDEVKVLRDPVHGYIRVKLKVVWDCINAKEFQRLRRIRQLGGAYQVYHTAEHSRFAHSLGVYEIVRKMVEENDSIASALSEVEKVSVMLAGLLHDLGHGPYSHSFEAIAHFHHEEMTTRILKESSEIHQVLEDCSAGLSDQVAQIIEGNHPNPLLTSIISGQLDADRMDYLLRDAYFTGTTYGGFDIQRVLRTMRIKENTLVVKYSGIHSVEDYIMARYHMYWQVYYHPTARSYEMMLQSFFMRLKDVAKEDPTILDIFPPFHPLVMQQPFSIEDHFKMDEPCFDYGVAQFQSCRDEILCDLSQRIANRRLFTFEDIISETQVEFYRTSLEDYGYHIKYYLLQDAARQRPYTPYKGQSKSFIHILTALGEIVELSEASVIVEALIKGKAIQDAKLYYPKELFTKNQKKGDNH